MIKLFSSMMFCFFGRGQAPARRARCAGTPFIRLPAARCAHTNCFGQVFKERRAFAPAEPDNYTHIRRLVNNSVNLFPPGQNRRPASLPPSCGKAVHFSLSAQGVKHLFEKNRRLFCFDRQVVVFNYPKIARATVANRKIHPDQFCAQGQYRYVR